MKRAGKTYRIGKFDVPRYKYEVIVLAQCLHGSVTGISDPLCANDGLFMYKFLKARLGDWNVSTKFSAAYDLAVMNLVLSATYEYECRDKARDEAWMKENGKELGWIPYSPYGPAEYLKADRK